MPETPRGLRRLIPLPHGIILVCGPTGSGKTTTLYSALSEINSPDKNILTIEDPVEYEMRGIGQTQVNQKIDLSFASVLRAHLRQDPDVILGGRDKETMIQASLTGHLVFDHPHERRPRPSHASSTWASNRSWSPLPWSQSWAAARPAGLHAEVFHHPTEQELREVEPSDIEGSTLYKAVGCPECR